MHFTLTEQLQFRHLGILHVRQRAVLFAKFGQRAGEPNFVLSIFDADGDSLSCGRSAGRRAERGSGSPVSDAIAGGEGFKGAKGTGSPSPGRGRFDDIAPISRANPPMRSSTSRELTTVAPSAKAPRSTRASDSLPPC